MFCGHGCCPWSLTWSLCAIAPNWILLEGLSGVQLPGTEDCSSLVKLYVNIHTVKLSPGIVHCKHCIVPQFTLMRMIYIYIAPFIPMDLRDSQTKIPRVSSQQCELVVV